MDISVVIPAYNEERVIVKTIEEVRNFLKNNFNSFEIIIVDDKSTDRTLEILRQLPDIILVRNLKNHGKGYSVAKGVGKASGEWILFMDADSSTKIDELKKFLPYVDKYALIIGSRALSGSEVRVRQNIVKVFLGRAGNFLIRLLLAPSIHDTQCGFKFFDKKLKDLFAKLTIEDWGFDFELIYLARKNNFSIKEVPVIWVNNFDSKVKWYNYPKTLAQVFKVKINNLIGKYN
ncbi:glycosyltransferase family 2 protein [Candidatus Parcubacteria bacterium]|nr:MAG: glycosyltransferase family 2 protein [Candidatus Parcubacteria bacterium]